MNPLFYTSTGVLIGLLLILPYLAWLSRRHDEAMARAQARVEDVEDRMLALAGRPDAVKIMPTAPGRVHFIDEAREVELDAS